MIESYVNNPGLFTECLDLLNEAFPGCKEFALNGIKYGAYWNKVSTPFVIMENNQVVAHAGIWPITFILNGKEHHSASIHGVCVKASHRGRGYFKQLMQEIMQYVKNTYASSVLFSVKPYLYKDYPYKVMLPEYDFVLNSCSVTNSFSDLEMLRWDNAKDINLIHQLLSNRVPLSNQLSAIHENANALFILNMMNKKIYYSKEMDVLIVYELMEKTLYIKEIISSRQHSLPSIVNLVGAKERFEKIILQFCPDKFLDKAEFSPILARPECCIMVSEQFLFNDNYFRYPELYWC
jgi:predicted GNAT family N-acyltransferase